MNNPYAWLDYAVFMEFAQEVGLNLFCQKCSAVPKNYFCDTGSDDGYLPRSSAYANTSDGFVNMADSRHIPCVRVTCVHCGHIELYSMFSVARWQQRKNDKNANASGSLFGLGQLNE